MDGNLTKVTVDGVVMLVKSISPEQIDALTRFVVNASIASLICVLLIIVIFGILFGIRSRISSMREDVIAELVEDTSDIDSSISNLATKIEALTKEQINTMGVLSAENGRLADLIKVLIDKITNGKGGSTNGAGVIK